MGIESANCFHSKKKKKKLFNIKNFQKTIYIYIYIFFFFNLCFWCFMKLKLFSKKKKKKFSIRRKLRVD